MILTIKVAVIIELLLLAAVGVFRACVRPQERGIVTTGDILLIAAIPLVGLFGHSKYALYGFLFAAPLFWTRDPALLARRYVLALVSFPDLAENLLIGGVYLGAWSATFFFNGGSLVALAATRRGELKPVRSIDAALWILFLIALLISARGVLLGGTGRFVATTFLLVVPPYFVIARTLRSRQAVVDTLTFLVLGGVCNAAIGFFESVRHWSLYENFYMALHVRQGGMSANTAIRAGLLRAGGTIVNYEAMGLLCGMALIAAVAIRGRFTSTGFYAVMAALAGGLLVTQAGSAWIATVVGLLLYALYERRWRLMAAVIGGAGLLGIVPRILPSQGRFGQMLGRSGHAESTGQYRQSLLDRGLEEVRRHPVTGQTLDQLQFSMNDLRQGDHIIDFVNTHLLVALVGGIGGLALWLVAWGTPLAAGWRRRRPVGATDPMIALPFAMAGMTFLFLAFTSPIDRILSLAAIAMALMSVAIRLPVPTRGIVRDCPAAPAPRRLVVAQRPDGPDRPNAAA